MTVVNRELLDQLMDLVMKAAESARFDAGMGGRYDDGGASRLEDQVKFFRYGLAAKVPTEWEQYKIKLDPEYEEYLRLQKKFSK